MAIKLPNKVGAWLTDSMLEHIDSKRDYRTRSEYLRMLVEADMAKVPPLKAKCEPRQPRWQVVRDVVSAQLVDEGLNIQDMIGAQVEHMGEQGFWQSYLSNPDCTRRMDMHEEQKTPR